MCKNVRKCEVCGEVKEVFVRSSSCGPISLAYCEDCLRNGYEPYKLLICYLAGGVSDYNELSGGYKKLVDINIKHHGKTVEEFNNDLKEENRREIEFWNRYEQEVMGDIEDIVEAVRCESEVAAEEF